MLGDGVGPKAPLLILFEPDQQIRKAVAVTDLLGSPVSDTRSLAMAAILRTGDGAVPRLLSTTVQKLESERARLLGSESWQHSAIAILDALNDDWLFQLALLRQCVDNRIDGAVARHAADVLRPSGTAIFGLARDFLGDGVAASFPGLVARIAESAVSAEEAIERYMVDVGSMPLGGALSAEGLLREWSKAHDGNIPRFISLLDWAKSQQSPLATHHVCRIGAAWPETLSVEDWPVFWQQVTSNLRGWSDASAVDPTRRRWELLSTLTAHFARFNEFATPVSIDSQNTCALAMWQAERVAGVFGNAESLSWTTGKLAEPELKRTAWIWAMARPAATRSSVRFASLNSRTLWETALLADIDRNIELLMLNSASVPQLNALAESVIAAFVTGFPPRAEVDALFDFGSLPRKLLAAFGKVGSAEQLSMLAGVAQLADTVLSPEDLLRAIGTKQVGEGPNSHAQFFAFRARMLAYVGELPDEAAWAVVSDRQWRKAVFVEGGPDLIEPVFDAMCELLTHNPGRWKVRFPHMLAETLEQDCEAGPDRDTVFGLLILSCVATETTSALERVLHGHAAVHLRDQVDFWRSRFLDLMPACPEWVKGRLRATLVVLHV